MRSIDRTRVHQKHLPPAEFKVRMERTKEAIHLFAKEHGPLYNVTLHQTKAIRESVELAHFLESLKMYEHALDFYEDVLRLLSQALVISRGRRY